MNKKLKKSILSLSVMSLLIATISTNAFAAYGDSTNTKTSGNSFTHCKTGGNYIKTTSNLYVVGSNGKIVMGRSKTVTSYGAMSNNSYINYGLTVKYTKGNHYVSGASEYLNSTSDSRY